jgi:hypothetical protein
MSLSRCRRDNARVDRNCRVARRAAEFNVTVKRDQPDGQLAA